MPPVPRLQTIRAHFNQIFGKKKHTLKDCRRTFSSHCVECGVLPEVREAFLGHAPQIALNRAYVEYSDDFLLAEGSKIDYWFCPKFAPNCCKNNQKTFNCGRFSLKIATKKGRLHHIMAKCPFFWWTIQDSNLWLPPRQGDTLPTELIVRLNICYHSFYNL